jgi:hypothetical protein
MFARNHQDVRWGLRVNVANHDAAFILMNEVGWNLSADYFAKQAILFCHLLPPRI